MNAGAYGGELRQVVRSVTLLMPEEGVQTLSCEEMDFGYRRSLLTRRPEAVVLPAVFSLTPDDSEKTIQEERSGSDGPPEGQPASANRPAPAALSSGRGVFAGTLIDTCGLKGLSVGGAQVSEKHAGFIINTGNATCADVKALIETVGKRVFEKKGVWLEPEVRIVEGR